MLYLWLNIEDRTSPGRVGTIPSVGVPVRPVGHIVCSDQMRIECAMAINSLCSMWKHVMFLCTYFIGVGMRVIAPLLLCLLSALVEVHSQTVPYLTIKGNNIPNHSYVDFNRVGPKLQDKKRNTLALHCNTDLSTCCTSAQGPDRGDWYFPNGSRLEFFDYITPRVVCEGRGSQQVFVYRIPTVSDISGISGIYRCDIETIAVNNNSGNVSLFVGLYFSGGE